MGNLALVTIAWLAVATHVAVGVAVYRRATDLPLVPLLNLGIALCVLAYSAQKWFAYFNNGITWYFSDQLLPLYAIVVCVVAVMRIAGRDNGALPHWIIFGVDALALLAAPLLFTFFRLNRLTG